jgi:hypothetical protein
VTRLRRSVSPILEISVQLALAVLIHAPIPSIVILPAVASTNLKKLKARVDLPQPVDPTIPTFSCPATVNDIP